ncbi:MAG: serine hydrolase domain-containing protein [Lawsonibacter sp.]
MKRGTMRQLSLVIALALCLVGCSSGQPEAHSVSREEDPPEVSSAVETIVPQEIEEKPQLTQEDVDAALEQVMDHYKAAGVSVATIEGGELSVSGAWGWAEKEKRPMTADTKVRIASISKVAVGLCAMAMAEDGLLELEAPLSAYWGDGAENPYSDGQPTSLTLMTHTSSLRDLDITRGLSKLEGLLHQNSTWRDMEPGDGGYWYYSNFGFCILGTTLELASDQVLDDYFQSRFLEPMGVRATFFPGKLEEDEVATLYTTGGVSRSAASHVAQSVPDVIGKGASYYPGGLTISAVDMAKLVCILANDGIYEERAYLTPETVTDLETPRFSVDPEDGTPFEQCLVLRRQENLLGQSQLYYHTGSAYGVFSLLSYNPETGNGVVVITTGTERKTDSYGLYALCSELSENLYQRMENMV